MKPNYTKLSGDQWTQLPGVIVGLEIEVAEIQGKFKLSQNRSIEDQQRVIEQLRHPASSLAAGLAALMAANLEA